MKIHILKTVNPWFTFSWQGLKNIEIRVNDRNFEIGDIVHLVEYEHNEPQARMITAQIWSIEPFEGLKDNYVILILKKIEKWELA